MNHVTGNDVSRRRFLKGAGGSIAAAPVSTVLAAASGAQSAGPRAAGKVVRIGIVGGSFGATFFWHLHPNSKVTAVCELRETRLANLSKRYDCANTYKSYAEMLKQADIDAVGVFTPAPFHVEMATQAMRAGKHVISAVPAGMSVEELELLLDTVKKTGMKYMMAETSRYRPEILTCIDLRRQGKFGNLYYAESEYHHPGSVAYSYSDSFDCQTCGAELKKAGKKNPKVATWAHGYPPMLYITHCTGMIVPVMGERLTEVVSVGWGDGHESLRENRYNSPFWNGVAFFKTSGGHSARVSVAWHVAAGACERGSFYGDRMSFIMQRPEKSPNTLYIQEPGLEYGIYEGKVANVPYDERKHLERLPEPLRVESGHGGSHTFITHEFISAIVEDRHPSVNAWEAVAYTFPGIVAHQSAMRGGQCAKIRDYGKAPV